jgi:hypothetical protein
LFTTHPPHGFVFCPSSFWVGIDLQTNTCSMLDWRKSWRWKNTEPIMEARVTINKKAKANSSLPEQDGTVVTHFLPNNGFEKNNILQYDFLLLF